MIYLKLFLTAVFWGGTFIAGRILAQEVQPWSGSFLRFLVASVGMIPLVWHFEGRLQPLRKKEVLLVFLSGMTGVFLYNVFFLTGLQTVQAGRASVIVASNPVLISLFAALLFRGERMTPRKILGVALSVCGAVFVITRGHPEEILQGAAGRGEMFIFGCVASWVSYSLIGKVVEDTNREFARVEQIKDFRLIDVLLTAEDEELTATMKLKRSFVEKKHKRLIDEMYGA